MNLHKKILDAIKKHHKLTGKIVSLDYVITEIKGDTNSMRVQKAKLKREGWVLKSKDVLKLEKIFPDTDVYVWLRGSN